MGCLIKAMAGLFFGKTNSHLNKAPDESLPVYHGEIEVDKYLIIKDNGVKKSEGHLFRTPDKILKMLNNDTLLWTDKKNDLLGYSCAERSKLFTLSEVKGFEIQNVLPAKGPGYSWMSLCLSNGKSYEIAEFSFEEWQMK
ncbi:MAG: hypothetical protein LBE92_14285 [Chryseobacterium sp.]|jgi:hypothetical protein|uniref:hypothetical protein n=1 Tax=Chryseobacterium sp. TaxID=1871047 RepID=UPI002839360A|nr:hypothetical protein [Chryseobacterium sp.]MDR2237287.1 hypothetical protein [Chryseobacterium sp.]